MRGRRALDFGCGTGRSTRFLKQLGFDVLGVDISEEMLAQARALDPEGTYARTGPDPAADLGAARFDVVLAVFTFDNVPAADKPELFASLARLCAEDGRIVALVSSPDIYVREWASFTTIAFPENRQARDGDRVRIVMTDVADGRPVEDVLCSDDAYRSLHEGAGLERLATYRPLGRPEEPYAWRSETEVSPWTIHVLTPHPRRGGG